VTSGRVGSAGCVHLLASCRGGPRLQRRCAWPHTA
jgi:hypothetical protein